MATPFNKENARLYAAAAQRRLHHSSLPHVEQAKFTDFDSNHKKRTEFRRILDVEILRGNSRNISMRATEILLDLSQNIINSPNNVKYLRFKPTNTTIQKFLVEPKGTLEYARAMGFDPKVEEFQPYYVFNKARMTDLCIGNDILRTRLKEEQVKVEKEETALESPARTTLAPSGMKTLYTVAGWALPYETACKLYNDHPDNAKYPRALCDDDSIPSGPTSLVTPAFANWLKRDEFAGLGIVTPVRTPEAMLLIASHHVKGAHDKDGHLNPGFKAPVPTTKKAREVRRWLQSKGYDMRTPGTAFVTITNCPNSMCLSATGGRKRKRGAVEEQVSKEEGTTGGQDKRMRSNTADEAAEPSGAGQQEDD
ncbi:hypothetical protein EIP91_006704 [Steccherinum ochraceum]|uniref:PUB domain-containing protein n=1 Tax=Steccherinum ochraceum TaxID=92696 RepID=A0A4V2MXD7_9APHY|nr:hypothetical protein EIP91_006704 [Steccherinum ochraceum]